MKLNLLERVVLTDILPQKGNFLELIIRKDLMDKIAIKQPDIEKYGIAKIKYSGTRDKPFYTTSKKLKLKPGELSITPETLVYLQKLRELDTVGTLDIIELESLDYSPEQLMDVTRRLIENHQTEFFAAQIFRRK